MLLYLKEFSLSYYLSKAFFMSDFISSRIDFPDKNASLSLMRLLFDTFVKAKH